MRRVRLHGRDPQGHARRAGLRPGGRPARAAGRADGPGLDLRPLRRRGRRRDASPFNAPTHPPIPIDEFDRTELLAMEKESIGIFISEHPLKRVREALKVKTDCSTAEVMDQRDGEWVKVGGMITESKKIRTRSGSTMMFATLDDLDGSVEIVVFEKALAAAEGVIADDAIVLVRGKRRPQGGRQGLRDRPGRRQVRPVGRRDREGQGAGGEGRRAPRPSALKRRVDAAQLPATVIDDLRELFERYPGDTEFVLRCTPARACAASSSATPTRSRPRDAGFKAELDGLLPPLARDGRGLTCAARCSPSVRTLDVMKAGHPPCRPHPRSSDLQARLDGAPPARARAGRTPTPCRPARSPCRSGPGPRRSPAGPRSAARRGRRSCPRCRSRRRRG